MKPLYYYCVFTFVLSFILSVTTQAQAIGTKATAVWLSDCNQSNYFNTSGSGADLIGPGSNNFSNANLGVHTQNSHTLVLKGAGVKTFKSAGANVCSARMHYRIYQQTGIAGSFTTIDLPLTESCNLPAGQYPSGGTCQAGDQMWSQVVEDGTTVPFAPIDLTAFSAGNYVLEVYYDITGSATSTTLCNETVVDNNSGGNYKANFSIQSPVLASNNPTTCNGTEGSITISGLVPGTTYATSYSDDGVSVGPNNLVANASGQIIISSLNAGVYSDFSIQANGCTTDLNTGLILTNPLITPKFNKIAPFCAGSTPPTLPATSLNGISGTWNPAVINNQTSAFYRFTPAPGQCGMQVTLNVTVTPNVTPTFSFGNSATICAGGSVPTLPATSTNGISGKWNPATIDNQNSATYTFTPNAGQCATTTTFTVTIAPNVVPTFSFGPALSVCAGASVPVLPTTSDNGITGSWSPATVDNQNSATYTFTPSSGQCATTTTFTVTVNPNVIPTFSIGSSINLCEGSNVPTLPTTSDNGITGSWSPAVINNQNSGTYTFTPSGGQCAVSTTFTVTITAKTTPVFSFGTTLSICAGGAVPNLATTSSNGISGVWVPSIIDDQASGTYTFTPDAGQCATSTSLSVTVTPNIAPTFSFGNALTICAGEGVPTLPSTSDNGITGSWSPTIVDNQTSGVYTFTPSANQCATATTFTVTVNPIVTPVFNFGSALTICAGDNVPTLPGVSNNGINGSWSPSLVDNQASGTYTFTPSGSQCSRSITFTVTVTAKITPTFSFGPSLNICAGELVPALPATATNSISGSWSPAVVDNQNSGTYTFTPTAGQCATTTTFTVTVAPNIVPAFNFGNSTTICAGGSVPTLPATSNNGISGKWNPATIDNQNSATYTFTPNAGQCATTTTFTVTVNPNVTPTFSIGSSLVLCEGGNVPTLPATSDNGISGTWSLSIINNQNSGTYTFTPNAGQCATSTTFTVTVTPKITPAFSFGNALTICAGDAVPTLPGTSDNGITGIWNAAIVDNQNSGTYIFTPSAGQCATTTSFSVTVHPIVVPAFNFGPSLNICSGSAVPTLPGVSSNDINGVWSPSVVDNQNSGTYTFTPAAGQCATAINFTVTVSSNITPTFGFGSTMSICAGSAATTLPTTSDNNITGTWSPSVINNQQSGTYIFTPASGQCATTASLTVTVNPVISPAFGFGSAISICAGSTAPVLPGTSDNGISGVWNPSIVDNQQSGVYTFTPASGLCANTVTFTVTVNPVKTPTFDFGSSISICAGSSVPSLPVMSTNNVSGSWNPSVVSNQQSGTYTFTPAAGQCATATTLNVTVNAKVVPAFSFANTLTICAGGSVPVLPTVSDNGIAGSWNPSVVSNQQSGSYTFTPATGVCASIVTLNVTVNPNVTPTFGFGSSLTICAGSGVPSLPAISENGIAGTWNPSVIDNKASAVYTFTPTTGQCATVTTFTVTVNSNITPAFSFGTTLTICEGSTVPALPTTSVNNIAGSWSPAVINNKVSGTYTFTPTTGQCATTTNVTVTVNLNIVPTFSFGKSLSICTGGVVPALPTTSVNGINGTWSPAVASNQTSATYTFTPSAVPGQCFVATTFTITVDPIVTPTFSFGPTLTVCNGSVAPALPATSTNGITGTWSPAVIDNQTSGVYTFTTAPNQCAESTVTLTVTVPPVATVNPVSDITVNDGAIIPSYSFTGTPAGAQYNWNNSNGAIGLAGSGIGFVPAFTATNKGNSPISSTITVTPLISGCVGISRSYTVTVIPLDKDVFVPNVFSPNSDGKNDILYVYGNYINKLDMRIFNQWGQLIEKIDSKTKGWDGKYKGQAQPVGVYVYVLQAELADGRIVNLKGSITLVR